MRKWIVIAATALLNVGCISNGLDERRGPGALPKSPHWVQSFELSPTDARPSDELLKKYPQLQNLPPLKGTMRYRFALSLGGNALRVQLTNEVIGTPLKISAASVALAAGDMDAQPATIRRLTFGGQSGVHIPVNATVLSDAVDLQVPALSDLVVSLYMPEGCAASPLGGAAINWVDEDVTMNATMEDPRRTVGRPVISAGISGNRVVSPGSGASALARVDRDVFAVPGIEYLIVLEGINDIGNSDRLAALPDTSPLDADALIAGLTQIAARAHARGLRVYLGTILPFRGAGYFSGDKEKIRLAVNSWIRESLVADGVIDFERAMKDPARPDTLNPPYDSGDHLHPSEAGYRAMAEAIPLELFK